MDLATVTSERLSGVSLSARVAAPYDAFRFA